MAQQATSNITKIINGVEYVDTRPSPYPGSPVIYYKIICPKCRRKEWIAENSDCMKKKCCVVCYYRKINASFETIQAQVQYMETDVRDAIYDLFYLIEVK